MPRRPDTRERVLDVAQVLIQTRGYSAISFDHIAREVGIKKPSIVHHFPNKGALGAAVVQRYHALFAEQMQSLARDSSRTADELLDLYFGPYFDFGAAGDKVCLCGALAGEFMALPEDLQAEVRRFFGYHLDWLAMILERGREQGVFRFEESPEELAALVLNAAQGALIIKRATGSPQQLEQTVDALRRRVQG